MMVCGVLYMTSRVNKKQHKPETKKETQITIRCNWTTRNRWGAYVKGNARTLKDSEAALLCLMSLAADQVKFI